MDKSKVPRFLAHPVYTYPAIWARLAAADAAEYFTEFAAPPATPSTSH